MKIEHTKDTWNLDLTEYELGNWGTAVNNFRVPNSVIKRFRIQAWVNNTTGDILKTNPNDTINYTEQYIFDKDKAFSEMCFTYINAIVASYAILRETPFAFFESDTKDFLRKAIYNAIEYSSMNNQFWENVNGSSISTPNFTINQEVVSWLLTKDMIGRKADNLITNSGLTEYKWVRGDVFKESTPNGNIKIIGKVDLEELPNLANIGGTHGIK